MTHNTSSQNDRPGEAAWRAIEPVWESINIYGSPQEFLDGFRAVPEPVGHLFAVHWCDSEICNGGFHQFFGNSTGILAPEALDGFRAIGLSKCADLLQEALMILGYPYPRKRKARCLRLKQVERDGEERAEWDPFYELDDQYYAAKNGDGLYKTMDRYANDNIS